MIYFHEVTKSFGNFKVLDNLTMHIPKGKISFIIGKSGEGKSVTIKHIMGLLKPDSGNIQVDQEDISKLDDAELRTYRQKFGMLFQRAALFDSLSVGENVLFPLLEHADMPLAQMMRRTEESLTQVGLPNVQHKYPNELSTGEKKRVGLARALVAKPKIILYDEPTTGMDPFICEMIDELIMDINKQDANLTSIVISHDLKAALATADNIIMLYKGKVQAFGSPEVFRKSTDPIVRQFFSGRIEGPMEFF